MRKLATPSRDEGLDIIKAFQRFPKIFPHVRISHIYTRIEQQEIVRENGIIITFSIRKSRTTNGDVLLPVGAVVIHQFVKEDGAAKGAADDVLARFLDEYPAAKNTVCALNVRKENTRAIALWTRHNFHQQGSIPWADGIINGEVWVWTPPSWQIDPKKHPFQSNNKSRTAIERHLKTAGMKRLPSAFNKRLKVLTTRGTALREAGKQWAQMYIEFCRDYASVYRAAQELDTSTDTKTATAALNDLFEGVSEPTKSKWRTVGASDTASTLLSPAVLKLLPPSSDSIYQLATLPPETLVTIDITPQATQTMVRLETARLSTKKKKTAAATVPAHTGAVSVKFDFDTVKRGATIKTLASTLHRLLSANPDLSVRIAASQDRDDLKEAMGEKKWKSIANRLGS